MAWLSSVHLSQWAYFDNSGDIGIRIGEKGGGRLSCVPVEVSRE